MNKKHELVEKVLKVLEDSHVERDAYDSWRAERSFWGEYPDGHYNDLQSSVEGELSCLTVENLEAILDVGVPEEGITYSKLWREWGRAGCFKCVPEVLQLGEVPTLRIRHDSYLSWFRGYRFQNSYDAYGNGSNGESENNLQEAIDLCRNFRDPECSEYSEHMTELELSVFCSALILYYPFYACRGKSSFYQAIRNYPEVFDGFMRQTDLLMRTGGIHTLYTMREAMASIKVDCPLWQEFSIENKGEQLGLLRLGENAVQLVWSAGGERQSYVLKFPCWMYDSADGDGQYMGDMWSRLAYTMLTLAGFSATEYSIRPCSSEAVTTVTSLFYGEDERVESLKDLWSNIRKFFNKRR